MSGASGVPTTPGAKLPGGVGAAVASAMTTQRAAPAGCDDYLGRDRKLHDDENQRLRDTARRDAEFALVKAARAVLVGKKPKPSTQANYTAKGAILVAEMTKLKGNAQRRLTEVLRRYAPVANSFFAMRAAAAWRFREEIRGLLREREMLQLLEQAEARDGVLDRIVTALSKLSMVQNMERKELLESGGGKSKRAQSKRLDLHRLPKSWREQIIGCSNGMAYEEIFWVLAATGCRPEELLNGVTLNLGHDHVHVRIAGAKVSDLSGQIWRKFKVSLDWLPDAMYERLEGQIDYVVRIASTGALRSALARAARRVSLPRLCPYHFRHAAAEDMRESGWTADEIGGALGHCVGETSSYYGRRRRRGKAKSQITKGSVVTAIPVRPLPAFDPAKIPKKRPGGPNRRVVP